MSEHEHVEQSESKIKNDSAVPEVKEEEEEELVLESRISKKLTERTN